MSKTAFAVQPLPGRSSFVFANPARLLSSLSSLPFGHDTYTCRVSFPAKLPVFFILDETSITGPSALTLAFPTEKSVYPRP